MPRRKLNYRRGTLFQVPLGDARRVAVGVVGDLDGHGGVLGFFFVLDALPADLGELARLAPEDAILVTHCGDLGLLDGSWRILAAEPAADFEPQQWQRLEFSHYDELIDRWEIRRYAVGDFGAPAKRRATEAEARGLPRDGTAGAGWVELRLRDLVQESSPRAGRPTKPPTPRRRAAA